jgi:hypothetical protein
LPEQIHDDSDLGQIRHALVTDDREWCAERGGKFEIELDEIAWPREPMGIFWASSGFGLTISYLVAHAIHSMSRKSYFAGSLRA